MRGMMGKGMKMASSMFGTTAGKKKKNNKHKHEEHVATKIVQDDNDLKEIVVLLKDLKGALDVKPAGTTRDMTLCVMFGSIAASGLQAVFQSRVDDIHLDEDVRNAIQGTAKAWDEARKNVTGELRKVTGKLRDLSGGLTNMAAPWMTEVTEFFSCELFQGEAFASAREKDDQVEPVRKPLRIFTDGNTCIHHTRGEGCDAGGCEGGGGPRS